MSKRCIDCASCVQIDYGYSNWTVEGTTVYCSKGAHPAGEFDRWYGEEPELKYAETCDKFVMGDGVSIDVDMIGGRIEIYTDDPDIIEWYNTKDDW